MAIVIGVVIGLLLGLTGAGGSIFAVPLLMLVLQLPASEAMGVSLGAVAVSALVGAANQHRNILWLPAVLLTVGGLISAPLGKIVALHMTEWWLVLSFTLIAIAVAYRMFRQASSEPELAAYVRGGAPIEQQDSSLACRLSASGQFQMRPKCIAGLSMGGIVIGFASGMFGVGGGFLIVPFLLYLSAISMPTAIATSLAIITLIGGSGFISHLVLGGIKNPLLLIQVLVAAIVGMLVSGWFSKRIAGPTLQKTFAILLAVIAIVLLVKEFVF